MAGISSILCLAVMAGIFINANAFDYCKITCKGNPHTMCIHKSPAPGPACKQSHDAGLTSTEKDLIVKKHNELRHKVASGQETRGNPGPQPPAAHMPDLTWDDELATIAQRHANQCVFAHDKCRNIERFAVGQNIAIASAMGQPPTDVVGMIENWYNEVKVFNKNDVSSFRGSTPQYKIGHYTQIVWANTVKIGCGRIKYKNQKNWDTNLLVCNYGPSGNWLNEKIY